MEQMIVDVYDSTADIFGDEQYVDHMRFTFENFYMALNFIKSVVGENGKAVVVSLDGNNHV